MKKTIIICLLVISTLTILGCGSSGGSSSTPATNLITPTITTVTTETAGTDTVATINGNGFGSPLSTSYVTYDGQKYSYSQWTETQIKLLVPFSSVAVEKFRVVVGSITSNATTNTNTMRIYGISPSSGNLGSVVNISGVGFGSSQVSGAYVTFYDLNQTSIYANAPVTSWSDTLITCTVPTNLQITQGGPCGVTVWKSSSIYTNSSSFSLNLPTISSVSPDTDNVGATINLFGSYFGTVQGTALIGGTYAPVKSWGENQISLRVPDFNSAGAKSINITINNKTYLYNGFTVAAPRVDGSYATSIPVSYDSTFTITGNHFGSSDDFLGTGGTTRSVEIIGVGEDAGVYSSVTSFTAWSDTLISFKWPVANKFLGTKTVSVTIKVGNNLSATISNITAD